MRHRGNVLLNADGGPAGAGATVSVPADVLGSDGILRTNESFIFRLDVRLASPGAYTLTVDANGVPHDWIHPDPPPAYDANNASFVFAVDVPQQANLFDYEADTNGGTNRFYVTEAREYKIEGDNGNGTKAMPT